MGWLKRLLGPVGWSLFLLGLVAGVIAGLSTTDGTASSLLGALFGFVGGGLLVSQRDREVPLELEKVAKPISGFAVGVLIGVVAGMFAREADPVGRLVHGKRRGSTYVAADKREGAWRHAGAWKHAAEAALHAGEDGDDGFCTACRALCEPGVRGDAGPTTPLKKEEPSP